MTPVYVAKIGFTIQEISIIAQKVDSLLLKIYDMVSAKFLLQNSLEKIRYFEKNNLLAITSMEVVLKILFYSLVI